MNADRFYDGIYDAANRTNEAAGRSWHIPARSRRAFGIVTLIQLAVCAVPVAALWLVLS